MQKYSTVIYRNEYRPSEEVPAHPIRFVPSAKLLSSGRATVNRENVYGIGTTNTAVRFSQSTYMRPRGPTQRVLHPSDTASLCSALYCPANVKGPVPIRQLPSKLIVPLLRMQNLAIPNSLPPLSHPVPIDTSLPFGPVFSNPSRLVQSRYRSTRRQCLDTYSACSHHPPVFPGNQDKL